MPREEPEAGEPKSRRISKFVDSARRTGGKSIGRLTGAESRKQFEEFTDAVTTTILGIHRDQSELKERLAKLENSDRPTVLQVGVPRLLISALIGSILALILGAIALAIAIL